MRDIRRQMKLIIRYIKRGSIHHLQGARIVPSVSKNLNKKIPLWCFLNVLTDKGRSLIVTHRF